MEQEAETARARANIYRLAAFMFEQEPSEAFMRELNAPAFREAALALGLSPPPLPTSDEAETAYEEMRAEYARLFIMPGTLLHPYESVQRGEGRLWGDLTVEVQQAYHDAGFELNPEANQVPDHLAVELEFMAHLANQEAEQWTAGSREHAEALRERQKNFLRDHLGAWAPTFAHTLQKETSHSYFRFLAEMLETVIESDLSFHNVSLEES